MMITKIEIDTSKWNNTMFSKLQEMLDDISEVIEHSAEQDQPDRYRKAYRELSVWHIASWKPQIKHILDNDDIRPIIKRQLSFVKPYNVRNHWKYGIKIWVKPGVSGLKNYGYSFDGIPPTFDEMIEAARGGAEFLVYGFGPKLTAELLKHIPPPQGVGT